MAQRSVHLGGSHIHWVFFLGVILFSNPRCAAELSIVKMNRNPVNFNMLQSLGFFNRQIRTGFSSLISTQKNILGRLRVNSISFSGVLIICTLNHTHLAPVKGKPFLLSSQVLSSFKMIRLQHSIRSCNDPEF